MMWVENDNFTIVDLAESDRKVAADMYQYFVNADEYNAIQACVELDVSREKHYSPSMLDKEAKRQFNWYEQSDDHSGV
ncbi:hypothetical protein [Alteromonas halophila]|nr:hypothetical protein [Alteromonas halophila]